MVLKGKHYSRVYNGKQQAPALCLLITQFYLVFKIFMTSKNTTQVIYEYIPIGNESSHSQVTCLHCTTPSSLVLEVTVSGLVRMFTAPLLCIYIFVYSQICLATLSSSYHKICSATFFLIGQ
jgi:hypothetical protein